MLAEFQGIFNPSYAEIVRILIQVGFATLPIAMARFTKKQIEKASFEDGATMRFHNLVHHKSHFKTNCTLTLDCFIN